MTSEAVDEHVLASLIKTHGNLYRGARLTRYPIPRFPLPEGAGGPCWTSAATGAGGRSPPRGPAGAPTGIDRAKKSVGAACRVAEQLGVDAEYVVGDARELPFGEGSFDAVFSYSVLQHLAKEDVPKVVEEIRRVLRPGGIAWIEMPNARGPLNLARQARRGFAAGTGQDVRYWTLSRAARDVRQDRPGDDLPDGFLTINPQLTDLDLLPPRSRLVVRVSDALRRASDHAPFLVHVADSVVVHVRAPS